MMEIPSTVYTHAGKFHADDVFSTALLRLLRPELKVIRTAALPENFEGFAFDIGWGAYDHHQKDAPVRENGVPYAAFGLLWKNLGEQLVGEEWQRFDEHFIQPLDPGGQHRLRAPACRRHCLLQPALGLAGGPKRKL